ncbi:YdcH family protein [Halovulum sp. GXIMD14794]
MTIHPRITTEALSAKVDAVRRRHRELDDHVSREQRRPLLDTTELSSLKREKLRLKDELALYEGLLRTLNRGTANA